MKKFLVLLSEKQPHLLNENLLNIHIDFLKKLRADNHLPLCGPFTDNKGALLIINADSLAHAENIIKEDPFIKQKYYKKFAIHEFMVAGEENNWLSDAKQTTENMHKTSKCGPIIIF